MQLKAKAGERDRCGHCGMRRGPVGHVRSARDGAFACLAGPLGAGVNEVMKSRLEHLRAMRPEASADSPNQRNEFLSDFLEL